MNALEEFEIFKASKTWNGHVLNDNLAFRSNEFYDTAVRTLEQYDSRFWGGGTRGKPSRSQDS